MKHQKSYFGYMAVYLISLELSSSQSENPNLSHTIKNLSNARWHHLKTSWIVITSKTSFQIKDELKQWLEEEDKLLVVKLNGDASWSGISETGSKWLRENL